MKLNKANREGIIAAAVDAAFKQRDTAHAKARAALADALYQHTYGDVEKIAKKLPQGWVAGRDSFTIVCEGFQRWISSDSAPDKLVMSRTRLFSPYSSEIKVDADHPLFAAAQAIVKEHNAITSAKAELRTKLHTLVHSVTTTERLRDAWPEGAKFLPAEVARASNNLPVPHDLVANVNALMGVRKR